MELYESMTLNGEGRNVERLGAFVAWLVANDLLNPVLVDSSGSSVARVRMQDLTGPDFLSTVLHGDLSPSHLNELGRSFTNSYFVSGQYAADYAVCAYKGEDEWLRFDEISPKISAAFRQFNQPKSALRKIGAKILKFPSRR